MCTTQPAWLKKIGRGADIVGASCYLDRGQANHAVLLTGVGRSGTTWLGGVLQDCLNYRSIFEPLFPRYVPKSEPFGYYPYLNARTEPKSFEAFIAKVINGKIRGKWVDRDNRPGIYHGRIIKEIRWNFLLGWLHHNFPDVKILLLARHPLDVFASWNALNWISDPELVSQAFAVPYLASNQCFRNSYPQSAELASNIDVVGAPFAAFLLQWILSYQIPIKELPSDAYQLFTYETLVEDSSGLVPILNGLGVSKSNSELIERCKLPSSTDFGNKQRQPIEIKRETILRAIKTSEEVKWVQQVIEAYRLPDLDNLGSATTDELLSRISK